MNPIESANERDEAEFEAWWATEPFGFDHPDTKAGILKLLKAERARSADLLKLANEIIDELTELAELHPDHTFEKINKLRCGNGNNQHANSGEMRWR